MSRRNPTHRGIYNLHTGFAGFDLKLIGTMMSTTDRIIVAIGAFAGGLALGLLFAPASGERTRRVARVGARRGSRWLSRHAKATQAGILQAGDEAAAKLKHAAGEAVERYIPDLLGDDEEWQDVYTRTAKDVEKEKR